MKYAILSDVHANLQALENVLADAAGLGVDSIVCLGDIVGYGPLPRETLERVRQAAAIVIAGNHDDAVSGRIPADDFIDLAAEAVQRHQEALTDDERAWLKDLPYTAALEGAIAVHGDFVEPPRFDYIDDTDAARRNFRHTDAQLMFVGHTHVPGIFLTGRSGNVYRLDPTDFQLETDKRYLVNPGSIGYPRESHGQCYSSYIIYDSTAGTVSFRRLPFSVASVMQRGPRPQTLKRRIVLAAVGTAALISGLAAWMLAPGETRIVEKQTTVEKTVYEDDPTLTVVRKTLTLPKSARAVRAGYRIERGPELADLHLVFRNADGSVIQTLKSTPKGSANQLVKIPAGAVSADFIVRRRKRTEQPQIKAFDPRWE